MYKHHNDLYVYVYLLHSEFFEKHKEDIAMEKQKKHRKQSFKLRQVPEETGWRFN